MPLSNSDKARLRRAGFLDFEIEEYDSAVDPSGVPIEFDLDAYAWQGMMRSRRRWVDAMLRQKWSDDEIENAIKNWYRGQKGRSPWDWLRAEYKPPRRITDYQEARQRRSKAEADKLYRRGR